MITVKVWDSVITVKGHSGYADHGKDIVCAGVSTLAQTLIKSIDSLTDDDISYSIRPGNIEIRYTHLSDDSKKLIDAFFIGCGLIAGEYPDNVKII